MTTPCAAGASITVTESPQHPGILYIGASLQDGTAGRVQIAVTRAEWDALVAGIKAEERERIANHVRELRAAARDLAAQTGGSLLDVGFHAQDEALSSVLYAIGGQP